MDADVEKTVQNKIDILASEPRLALAFCSTELFEEEGFAINNTNDSPSRRRSARRRRVDIPDYLRYLLPPSCNLAGVAASGVVGTSSDCIAVRELEDDYALSLLLMPSCHWPDLDIYTFHAGRDLKDFLGEIVVGNPTTEPDAEKLARVTNIPSDKHPKLVLLFHLEIHGDRDTDLCAAIVKHYGSVVVAGGFVDHLMVAGHEEEARGTEVILHGVAFCGEHLKVASVLLPHEINDADAALCEIAKLKTANIPEQNTIGFMFACIGRGQYHYDRQVNVEANAFHKLFPKTPLLGFFGNGELGYEYLPNYRNPATEQNWSVVKEYEFLDVTQDLPVMQHSYTTVFVLLSLEP